jgi:hypothetical protein
LVHGKLAVEYLSYSGGKFMLRRVFEYVPGFTCP